MKKLKGLLALILCAAVCIPLCGCDTLDRIFGNDRYGDGYYDNGYYDNGYYDNGYNNNYNDPYADNHYYNNVPQLVSHYIDVGQGDSEFIEFPDGQTMLIDAGPAESGNTVVNYIKNLGYSKIDYVVATHPHTDHIGGMKKVINSFDVGKIFMPKATSTTSTYSNLLEAIAKKGKKVTTTNAGTNIFRGNDSSLSVKVLAPVGNDYESLNDYSIVLKVTYGKVRLLYMGDAEQISENEILKKNYDVSADVIKVGHHGSSSSSGKKFVNKVKPQYAIMSLGAGNDYHHPHNQVVNRWIKAGAEIIRTDECGDIVLTTDGDQFNIDTEKGG